MSRFILVHGSWHGAWCWEKVVPRLEAVGHSAVAIDLPGHGHDHSASESISLDGYAARVTEAVGASPEPAIVVAHSMGGAAVTQAALVAPEGMEALVYLTAFIPQIGESVVDLANSDAESLIAQSVTADPVHGTAHVEPHALRECFYADCTEEDFTKARSRLRPDPMAPLITPLRAGSARSAALAAAIPRVYIGCAKDRAVTPQLQRRMYERAGCHAVYSLDTGHSPFLSAPDELVQHLLAAARIEAA